MFIEELFSRMTKGENVAISYDWMSDYELAMLQFQEETRGTLDIVFRPVWSVEDFIEIINDRSSRSKINLLEVEKLSQAELDVISQLYEEIDHNYCFVVVFNARTQNFSDNVPVYGFF